MDTLGKWLYVLPTIPAHRVAVGGKKLLVSEQLVGVLWLIDLLGDGNQRCLQSRLTDVFERWWPAKTKRKQDSACSRIVGMLLDHGLIGEKMLRDDRRKHLLYLTDAGSQFLAKLQEQRVAPLAALLTAGELEKLFGDSAAILDRAWKTMIEEIDRPTPKKKAKKK
ncbi:MAG TPA: MarR family winged helix-turn-helix transcriptional regulator [Thermoanaerobaculia bacterium]